jgi:hypothetical protein
VFTHDERLHPLMSGAGYSDRRPEKGGPMLPGFVGKVAWTIGKWLIIPFVFGLKISILKASSQIAIFIFIVL